MRNRTRFAGILVLLFLAVLIQPSSGRPRNPSPNPTAADNPSKVVYVCACSEDKILSLHDRGQDGRSVRLWNRRRPSLKAAVPQDSAWAKENRKELGR